MIVTVRNSITALLLALLLNSFTASGQLTIHADTLSGNCPEIYKMKESVFIYTSYEEYASSVFYNEHPGGCMTFADIDFDQFILVGHKYRGSSYDRSVFHSRIYKDADGYTIEFSTSPPQVCRDGSPRIAWFLVDKIPNVSTFKFKRVTSTKPSVEE